MRNGLQIYHFANLKKNVELAIQNTAFVFIHYIIGYEAG